MSKNYNPAHDPALEVHSRWVVIASRTQARIFKYGNAHGSTLIHKLDNPEGRMKEQELDSDRPGRAGGGLHTSYSNGSARHDQVADRFAGEVSTWLETAAGEGRFNEVVLAAEPHFLGLLRKGLGPKTKKALKGEVARDLAKLPDQALWEHLAKAMENL